MLTEVNTEEVSKMDTYHQEKMKLLECKTKDDIREVCSNLLKELDKLDDEKRKGFDISEKQDIIRFKINHLVKIKDKLKIEKLMINGNDNRRVNSGKASLKKIYFLCFY